MATYTITDTILTSIADAIRIKGGTSSSLSYPDGFVSAIEAIPSGQNIDELMARTISVARFGSPLIGSYAFWKCQHLISADFPQCLSIEQSAFASCSSLANINFPMCISIGSYAFDGCRDLTTLNFPNCTTIGASAFNRCISLSVIRLSVCNSIGGYAFYGCSNLRSLYLLSTSCVSIYASNVFNDSTIQYSGYLGFFGSIYVPSSLLNTYKTSTYWSTFSSRFVGI